MIQIRIQVGMIDKMCYPWLNYKGMKTSPLFVNVTYQLNSHQVNQSLKHLVSVIALTLVWIILNKYESSLCKEGGQTFFFTNGLTALLIGVPSIMITVVFAYHGIKYIYDAIGCGYLKEDYYDWWEEFNEQPLTKIIPFIINTVSITLVVLVIATSIYEMILKGS